MLIGSADFRLPCLNRRFLLRALAAQGDKAGAKAAFDAVQGQPRADLAGFWKTYLDAQA